MSEVNAFFDGLKERVDKSKIAGMNTIYQFNITGDAPKTYSVKIADGDVCLAEGADAAANIELTISDADFTSLVNGSLNGMNAFLQGKLKIKGDMTLAMKLQSIFKLG